MADEKYQGWTNRETWIVNLWLTNEEGLYNRSREHLVHSPYKARALEEFVDGMVEEMGDHKGFIMDLLNASLARVNWAEIVSSLMED